MTMKEKVKQAIAHKSIDFVPTNIEITGDFGKSLEKVVGVGNIDIALNNHMLRKKYKKNKVLENGDQIDLFGVTWQASPDGGDVGIVKGFPLIDGELEDYTFPKLNKELADSIIESLENEKERYTMFSITMGFFERAWSLYGMENILVDMIIDEEKAFKIFEGIYEHHWNLLDYILDKNFDAVYFGDDWGQQKGLIMGPNAWRTYIKPMVKKLFEKVKSKGKQIVLHSCGDLREIMPDLIEMGVDVYNTVQPEIYDLAALKNEYGKDLTFYGGISTQQFLPFATEAQVREETKKVLDIMMKDGGYILSPTHAVTNDIPVANILALVDEGKKFFGK